MYSYILLIITTLSRFHYYSSISLIITSLCTPIQYHYCLLHLIPLSPKTYKFFALTTAALSSITALTELYIFFLPSPNLPTPTAKKFGTPCTLVHFLFPYSPLFDPPPPPSLSFHFQLDLPPFYTPCPPSPPHAPLHFDTTHPHTPPIHPQTLNFPNFPNFSNLKFGPQGKHPISVTFNSLKWGALAPS